MKRSLLFLALVVTTCAATRAQNSVNVYVRDTSGPVIDRNIYGHFSEDLGRCIYDGFWTGDKIRMDVVDALKKIKIPILRWPGGCYADQYHWRDAIGPRNSRKKTVNTTWGMVVEDNSFGTHEFLELCKLLDCQPYIAGNVGSGTPEEMENWLEYLNFNGHSTLADLRRQNGHDEPFNVSYWGVGNESWGCGGNMTPEYYATQYRRYAEFCKNYPGAPRLKLIASGANSDDYNWTDVVMKNISLDNTWGLSMHYYTLVGDWNHKGSATQFGEDGYFKGLKACLHIEDLINKHSAIMDRYDPAKKVALVVDEWGIWTDAEPGSKPGFLYQQNSFRDALIAASTLNIFNNHADRIKMANLAQTVNVLQALVLTEKDKMVLTPTYHVFDLYKVHQGAKSLEINFMSPDYVFNGQRIAAVNASASRDGALTHISLVNLDPLKKITVRTNLGNIGFTTVTGQVLTSGKFTDINTFDKPNVVKPAVFNGAKKDGNDLVVDMPPMSVVVLELK